MSPTQRTRAYLKAKGFISHITEKWNSHAKITQDMFGFIDLVYLDTSMNRIVGVQVTSGANHANRKAKIIGECRKQALEWMLCEGAIEVFSWSKRKSEKITKKGKRSKQMIWVPRIEEIEITELILRELPVHQS